MLKLNFQKNKVASGQSPFFVIGQFCTLRSICLNLAFDGLVLNGYVALSFLML